MRAAVLVFFAADLVSAVAQESLPADSRRPTATPSREQQSEREAPDALGAAKRDFDAVRQSRTQGTAPGERALPRFTLPELNQGAGAIGTAKPADAANRTGGKSRLGHEPNWLVNGVSVERDEERRRGDHGGRERSADAGASVRRGDASISPTGTEMRSHDPNRARPARIPEGAGKSVAERAAAANPLNPFLADWMSPSDYALLAARGGGDRANAAGARGQPAPVGTGSADWLKTLSATDPEIAAVLQPSGDVMGTLKPGQAGGPANPFLAALEPAGASNATDNGRGATGAGARDVRGLEMANLPAVARAPQSSLSSTLATPPGATPSADRNQAPAVAPVPDFAKPKTDEKLFKPLKRF